LALHPVATIKQARSRIFELTGIKRGLTQVREWLGRCRLKRRKVGMIPAKADLDTLLTLNFQTFEKTQSMAAWIIVTSARFDPQTFLQCKRCAPDPVLIGPREITCNLRGFRSSVPNTGSLIADWRRLVMAYFLGIDDLSRFDQFLTSFPAL